MGKKQPTVGGREQRAHDVDRIKFHQREGGAAKGVALGNKVQRLKKLVERKGASKPDVAPLLVQLAAASLELGRDEEARLALGKALVADKDDKVGARHLQAPLLLRLGKQAEASALLEAWRSDESTVMLCVALMLRLAAFGRGEAEESEVQAEFDVLFAANWHLCVLLAAQETAAEQLPEATCAALREAHAEAAQARAEGKSPRPGAEAQLARGGVEEAFLLTDTFGGWAGDEEVEEEEEPGWPGLHGADAWLSFALLKEAPPAAVGVPADARKQVALYGAMLDGAFDEIKQLVLEADAAGDEGDEEEQEGEGTAEMDEGDEGDEGEEGDEEEEGDGTEKLDEGEAGDEEEEATQAEEARGEVTGSGGGRRVSWAEVVAQEATVGVPPRVATEPPRAAPRALGGRSAEAFEAWKGEKRAALQAKLVRAARGEPESEADSEVSDEEGESEPEDEEEAPTGRQAAFEAWKGEKRAALQAKLARAARGEPESEADSEVSDEEEPDDGTPMEPVEPTMPATQSRKRQRVPAPCSLQRLIDAPKQWRQRLG